MDKVRVESKNTNSYRFKERVYRLMNGTYDLDIYSVGEMNTVETEFSDGKYCEELYKDIFEANCRICERLGEEEDKDVEIIIHNYNLMTEYLCMKMFDYGVLFCKREIAKTVVV